MEIISLIIHGLILIETSFLACRSFKKSFNYFGQKRKIYVDSSALMDGRVLKVAQTGFLGGILIIPRSVIHEMQLLADGKDSEKRTRARFGLDVVSELERIPSTDVVILKDALDRTPVDERLLQLAEENHGAIMTIDYNLGKVASTMNIEILNINECFTLKITSTGSNPKQGVGYLPDGMMVVVDNASDKIGESLDVMFEKFLQTNSGRMMFAKIVPEKSKKMHKTFLKKKS